MTSWLLEGVTCDVDGCNRSAWAACGQELRALLRAEGWTHTPPTLSGEVHYHYCPECTQKMAGADELVQRALIRTRREKDK